METRPETEVSLVSSGFVAPGAWFDCLLKRFMASMIALLRLLSGGGVDVILPCHRDVDTSQGNQRLLDVASNSGGRSGGYCDD